MLPPYRLCTRSCCTCCPASFYHDLAGQQVRHDRVHNLYGGSMTRAAGEAFADLRPGRRTLLYSRSSIIGSHRYGGIWLGDNHSSWEQLLANIQMMPSVQTVSYTHLDVYKRQDRERPDGRGTGQLL